MPMSYWLQEIFPPLPTFYQRLLKSGASGFTLRFFLCGLAFLREEVPP